MSGRQIALYVTIAGLVIAEALTAAFILGASPLPDPATGRVEAYVFARVISSDPSYITLPQIIAISAAHALAVLGFLVYGALSAKARFGRGKAAPRATVQKSNAISRCKPLTGFGRRQP